MSVVNSVLTISTPRLFSRLIPPWYSWNGLFSEISCFLIKCNKHILSPWKKCAFHGSLNHHVSQIIQLHPHAHLRTKPYITKTPSLLITAEPDTVTFSWTKRYFIMSLLSSDLAFLRNNGKVLLRYIWLCNPMDCNPPVSSVLGILQIRILEWVASPFLRESSQPRNWTLGLLHCRQILYHLSHQGILTQRGFKYSF